MSPFASGILGHIGTLWGDTPRDLIIITLVSAYSTVVFKRPELILGSTKSRDVVER